MDVLKEVPNQRGSRETLSEQPPIADSQSNGFIERGIRFSRGLLFDLSSREFHFSSFFRIPVDRGARCGDSEHVPCGE